MISKRIKTIASLIEPQESVIDIGCDHCYLLIYLRNNGHQGALMGTELREGPFNNALNNLQAYGYDDIRIIQCDGVQAVDEQMQVAVMSGMGYHTVTHIMENDPAYFENCDRIIIQVNSDVDKLRRWLMENGYAIIDENIIKDYKYYEILTVTKGEMELTEQQITFGPVLLEKRGEIFDEYYNRQIAKYRKVMDSLSQEHPDHALLESKISAMEDLFRQRQLKSADSWEA